MNRGMSYWVQEKEQEDREQSNETGNNRWVVNREMRQETDQEYSELRDVRRQETEQEDFKQRDESGDRTQNGENMKEGARDFVVLTCESIISAGSIAQVKEFGSLIKPCNICS